jgi:hypothetical protein
MRIGLALSVIVHAAIMLWATLAPLRTTPYERSAEPPLAVDLVPEKEVAPQPEPTKPPLPLDAAHRTPAPSQPEVQKPQVEAAQQANQSPDPQSQKPQQPSEAAAQQHAPAHEPVPPPQAKSEQPGANMTWLHQVLNFPFDTDSVKLDAPPSESKANLARATITEMKAHVMKCWVPPKGVTSTERVKVVIRVAFAPSGAIAGEPTLVEATASPAGPALVQSAMRAIRQCQPYNFLPANAYKEWKVLDLSFTPAGLIGA